MNNMTGEKGNRQVWEIMMEITGVTKYKAEYSKVRQGNYNDPVLGEARKGVKREWRLKRQGNGGEDQY